jgi:hypothetical protein
MISVRLALVTDSLCRKQEERRMREARGPDREFWLILTRRKIIKEEEGND